MSLKPEDYLEPACPLCMSDPTQENPVRRIDLQRMMQKLDEHLGRNDYVAALRHLKYWLAEADFYHDVQGTLAVYNELMGLHRKMGHKDAALSAVSHGLSLIERLNLEDTVTAGTTYVNAATVYKAFDMIDKALPLYCSAQMIYEKALCGDDPRLGGLYNNMALALSADGQYEEADDYYRKALKVMEHAEHGALEQAITYLNMADNEAAKLGILESEGVTEQYLDQAQRLLKLPELPRNGYYAFVCEKCAPTFRYFGRFAFAEELEALSKKIYERA